MIEEPVVENQDVWKDDTFSTQQRMIFFHGLRNFKKNYIFSFNIALLNHNEEDLRITKKASSIQHGYCGT